MQCIHNKLTAPGEVHVALREAGPPGTLRLDSREPPLHPHVSRLADAWRRKRRASPFFRTGSAFGMLPCGGPLAGISGVLHGVWLKTLAYLVLRRRERAVWENLHLPPIGRYHWLLGCSAAKDAVRMLIQQHCGKQLCVADVEILADASGTSIAGAVANREN